MNIARQACDGCRVRKTKCHIANSSTPEPSQERDKSQRCRRCSRVDIPCTFLLPVGTRGPRKKIDRASRSPQTPQSAVMTENSPGSILGPTHPTGALCSRQMINRMMNDYLDFLYPFIPVVHRPSFRRDLDQGRDSDDSDFLGLIVAMSAALVGVIPRKFREYQSSASLRFQTRTEMINYCCDMVLSLRGPAYFDEINYQKWAASYLLSISFFQIGQHNRARMIEVESMQLARLLELHQISSYDGLNCIETQLRKKGFWLMFYGYVHSQLQNLRKERLTFLDPPILNHLNLEDLMPLEVDDEFIHSNVVLPQPASDLSLTTAFNIASRIFWAALTSVAPRDSPAMNHQHCDCVRSRSPVLQYTHLEGRLHHLKYMLDEGLPMQLRQWATATATGSSADAGEDSERKRLVRAQFESMRANIHVTHLWLQSIISDQIDTIRQSECGREESIPAPDSGVLWREREDLCRQLLHVLHSIEGVHLEPNGHHLVCKVRDVAVSLLGCPFDPQEEVSKRATEYLLEFTNILSRLDGSEKMSTLSLQSWVDTDRNTPYAKNRW